MRNPKCDTMTENNKNNSYSSKIINIIEVSCFGFQIFKRVNLTQSYKFFYISCCC